MKRLFDKYADFQAQSECAKCVHAKTTERDNAFEIECEKTGEILFNISDITKPIFGYNYERQEYFVYTWLTHPEQYVYSIDIAECDLSLPF